MISNNDPRLGNSLMSTYRVKQTLLLQQVPDTRFSDIHEGAGAADTDDIGVQ